MILSAKDYIEAIDMEINWCINNKDKDSNSKEYKEAFIKGLEQAKHVINSLRILR